MFLLTVNIDEHQSDSSSAVYKIRLTSALKTLVKRYTQCTLANAYLKFKNAQATIHVTTDISNNAYFISSMVPTGLLGQISYDSSGSIHRINTYPCDIQFFNNEFITVYLCDDLGRILKRTLLENVKINFLTLKFY